jgi:PAS domain S-box-containing protein
MESQIAGSERQAELRLRALSRLERANGGDGKRAGAAEALGVLFELASSPSTASDALALLHELQVLQVELDLQDEELRSSRIELEQALARQVELYDCAPVSCFTIDARTTLCEMNLTGARLLGAERDALLGRALNSFLAPRSADALQTLLARVSEGHREEDCELALIVSNGESRLVHACATADPAGLRFLIAFIDTDERKTRSKT